MIGLFPGTGVEGGSAPEECLPLPSRQKGARMALDWVTSSVCHSGSHDKLRESFAGLQAQREAAAHMSDVLLGGVNRKIQSKRGDAHHLCAAGPHMWDQTPGEEVT